MQRDRDPSNTHACTRWWYSTVLGQQAGSGSSYIAGVTRPPVHALRQSIQYHAHDDGFVAQCARSDVVLVLGGVLLSCVSTDRACIALHARRQYPDSGARPARIRRRAPSWSGRTGADRRADADPHPRTETDTDAPMHVCMHACMQAPRDTHHWRAYVRSTALDRWHEQWVAWVHASRAGIAHRPSDAVAVPCPCGLPGCG